MNYKQRIIVLAGIIGVAIVGLCPRWVYHHATLKPNKRNAGYRFISERPPPLPVIKQENGGTLIVLGQKIQPQIDYGDVLYEQV